MKLRDFRSKLENHVTSLLKRNQGIQENQGGKANGKFGKQKV